MINWIISSSCLIMIVLLVRRLFTGKISLRLQYALWLLVAVRLLIPINLGNSAISVENFINHMSEQKQIDEIMESEVAEIPEQGNIEGIKIYDSIDETRNEEIWDQNESKEIVTQTMPAQPEAKKIISYENIFVGIWLSGIVILGGVFLVSNFIFAGKLKKSRSLLENSDEKLPVYESPVIDTPCLFGVFKPAIYVTANVARDSLILRHAVCHERSHYQQGDLFWAPLRCVCLMLHWYNPLVWWAVKVSKQDAELACDESTIRKLGEEERLCYGKTLIQLTCEKPSKFFLTATTMTTGKKSIKERIERIAKGSGFRLYAFLGVILVTVIAAGCTFTGAQDEKTSDVAVSSAEVQNEEEEDSAVSSSDSEWKSEEHVPDNGTNAEKIIDRVNDNLREGYQDAKLIYVDNEEVGWNFYSDNPWSTDVQRDALAQTALKELYNLTGYNVTECTYTTDGRSRFIFGKNADYIKKCIAFYSRDYGFTLCGDSVPYQGFMNARKFHYSDVQQLISPLDGGNQEYAGGLSAFYLEHSGVYQGEKIIAHEEINKDDTVYTHVKLMFDGGYYVVVLDKRIESCHEVMGPYYDEAEPKLSDEPGVNQVCLAVMPDGVSKTGGDYRYIIPEDQVIWTDAYKEMRSLARADGKWREDERSSGIWIVYNDEWTCLTDQGFLINHEKRTEVSDSREFYDLCLNEVKKYEMNEPVRPEEIKNLVQATLLLEDEMYLLTDERSLFEIQKSFSSSWEIRGGTGCPFTAILSFKNKDGEMKTVYLATDSCNTWLSSGVYYQNPGFEDIEELRSYFLKHQQ